MKKIINFFMESYAELKKVAWPSRDDVVAQTFIVIISLLIVSLILFFMDFASFNIIDKIIRLGK